MHHLLIGVNTAMFDGIDIETAFSTIHKAGFSYIELAYNQGYIGQLNADLFSEKNANYILQLLEKYQLKTQTLGCTMNLADKNAIKKFTQRIRFARRIGVTYLAACIGKLADRKHIINNLRELAIIAEDNNCVICIENAGDPDYNVFSLATDGFALLYDIAHPAVAFNVDAGNIVSLYPQKDAIQEALAMLPSARHCHIKDVKRQAGKYFFPAIGDGDLDYRPLLQALQTRSIPCSLEIPLRMHRQSNSYPLRAPHPVDPDISLKTLIQSRITLETWQA